MKALITTTLAALGTLASGQSLTFLQTEFQFVSLERSDAIAKDIGRIAPEPKGAPRVVQPAPPSGSKFVVVRFGLSSSPPRNPQTKDARLTGLAPGASKPQQFKALESFVWCPPGGTWSAAFKFVIPDDVSLTTFSLADQTMDVASMEHASSLIRQ